MARHRISVCASCAAKGSPPAGKRLRDRLAGTLDPAAFDIRTVDCLSVCSRPLALAAEGFGKATYVFAGVDADEDLEAALVFGRLYADAPDGWIEDARPLGRLRLGLVTRIPAWS